MMKKELKAFKIIVFITILLITVFACKKDDGDGTPEPALAELLIGSWQMSGDGYTGTITFDESFNGMDYFIDGTFSGSGDFSWRLTDNSLVLTFVAVTGDYENYNEMGVGYIVNATISIANDQLTFDYGGATYVYTKVPDAEIIDENDLLGTWQMTDGSYKDFVSFELSNKAYNEGVNSFIAEADSGAADILWNVNGNMILIYYYSSFYGDYETYNEVDFGDAVVLTATVTDSQLTFNSEDTPYTYSKVSEDNALYRSDLSETIWQYISGDYSEILSFGLVDESSLNHGASSFVDNGSAGATDDFLWTVCGDLLTINYRSYMMGDYTTQTGITQNTTLTYTVSLANDQLTLNSNVYTVFPAEDVIDESDLIGAWQLIDGDYTGTLTFVDGLSTDEFTDIGQSGSAEFSWYLNGNMLSFYFDGTMTGDYETYNGTSQYDSYTTLISISGSSLSIESDGVTYVYTKQ